MSPKQYKAFVARAGDELNYKQNIMLVDYGIGTFADVLFDQPTGKLYFKDKKGRTLVEADVTPLGSFSTKTRTWLWAWANESLLPALREKAVRLKTLARTTGKAYFEKRRIKGTETGAWRLAGIGIKHLGSQGCYRIPKDDLWVFLALDEVVKVKGKGRRTTSE